MNNLNPLLLVDFYKPHHNTMYPDNMSQLYSNLTPRKSRIPGIDRVVAFGPQHFVLEYLIRSFNENFFCWKLNDSHSGYGMHGFEFDSIERIEKGDFHRYTWNKDEIISEYKRHIPVDTKHIEALWDLGFLPILVKSLDEGTLCPIGVPMLTIQISDPEKYGEFAWLVNYLETLLSCMLWQPITSATIALEYKKLLTKYCLETDEKNIEFVNWQGHDFSMRGMSSVESAILSGMGHLLSFTGTDTIPAIYTLEQSYDAKGLIGASVPACYDNQTEILTDKGWKLFKDLDKTELVAQYTLEKEIEFVKPLDYFKDRYQGQMIEFKTTKGYKYVDALVTPNHKMVRLSDKDNINLFEAGDFSYKNRKGYSHRNKLIISGNVISKIKELSWLERLKIAFQADGSFPSHKKDYTRLKGKGFPIRFSLKKERKKERLELILKLSNLEYTINKYKNGYYSFWINVPEPFVKDFSWVKLEEIGYGACVDFINELQYWDGCVKNNCIQYSSTNIKCVDIVQAICAISNYKSQFYKYNDERKDSNRQEIYGLTIQPNKNSIGGNNTTRQYIDYDDYVYCVSVPSKMIVTRRNNIVLICGNTEHSVMCMGTKESEIDTFKRLLNLYPEGILSVVSDTWDLWKVLTEYLPILKEQILSRNGKLVIRPDSGDPVDIICGTSDHIDKEGNYWRSPNLVEKSAGRTGRYPEEPIPSTKGVIELLWDIFGGTINEQGYKVLDSHIGAIYGDSITLDRAQQICERLKAKGFASTNIVFGIGSYTYQYNTRDTFGFAMKATYGEITHKCQEKGCLKSDNGFGICEDNCIAPIIETREIFKDPITDDGTKKSKKGLLKVYRDGDEIKCKDQCTKEEEQEGLLTPLFKDGHLVKRTTLEEIRNKLKQHE